MKKISLLVVVFLLLLAPLAAQGVKVVSPNGGESWVLNSSHNITWTSTNPGNVKVDIILRNTGGKVGTIKSQVMLSLGSWLWQDVGKLENGTMAPAGTDYTIRIRDTGNTCSDDSNNVFSIGGTAPPPGPPSITVTSPNGGERWILGEIKAITWKAENWNGSVTISIRKPANCSATLQASEWKIAHLGPAASGQFMWPVGKNVSYNGCEVFNISAVDSPKMLGECNCFQIIISSDGPSPNLSDQSDGTFYICRSKVSPSRVPVAKK
jgi:hypothetical protein